MPVECETSESEPESFSDFPTTRWRAPAGLELQAEPEGPPGQARPWAGPGARAAAAAAAAANLSHQRLGGPGLSEPAGSDMEELPEADSRGDSDAEPADHHQEDSD